jgi:hypothetical protein
MLCPDLATSGLTGGGLGDVTVMGKSDPNDDRARLEDAAAGRESDQIAGEPWAKTSSGDADSISEGDEGEEELRDG